ncbi:hypothetical protein ACFLYA_01660 [Candidatus Dependentiae bacterium]
MKKEYCNFIKLLSLIVFVFSVLLSGNAYSHVVFRYNNSKKKKKSYQVKNRSKLILEKNKDCIAESKKKRVGRYNQITAASELYLRPVSELIEEHVWLVDENFADYIDEDELTDLAYEPVNNYEVMTDKDYLDQSVFASSARLRAQDEKECWMVSPEALSKKILLNYIKIRPLIEGIIDDITNINTIVNSDQSLVEEIASCLVGCISKKLENFLSNETFGLDVVNDLDAFEDLVKGFSFDVKATETCIVALANSINENQDPLNILAQVVKENEENLHGLVGNMSENLNKFLVSAFVTIPNVLLYGYERAVEWLDWMSILWNAIFALSQSVRDNQGEPTKYMPYKSCGHRGFAATITREIAPDTDSVNTALEKMFDDFANLKNILEAAKSSFKKARGLQKKNVKLYKKNQEVYKKNLTYKSVKETRVIDNSGTYTLDTDFEGKILIKTGDVILDLGGNTLFCGSGFALTIHEGCKNVTIKNGCIVGGDDYIGADCGLFVKQGAQSINLENIDISFCYQGICFDGKDGSEIKNCTIKDCILQNNNKSVVLCCATDVYFKACTFKDFFQRCIQLYKSDKSYFEACDGVKIAKNSDNFG